MPVYEIKSIRDLELKNKRVFMRLDLNVPLGEVGEDGLRKIEDDTRIREALPTILMAVEKQARIVIASHCGRPDGKRDPKSSLAPVHVRLSELLQAEINMADDCVGEGIELMSKNLKPGEILLLENLRYHAEEEKNDPSFAAQLAHLGEVYISDAFGTCHRKHASTYGMAQIIQTRAAGLLIEKEVKFLEKILHKAEKPFYAVLGGSKVADKIKVIESLMKRVDGFLIGGAMGHAFWMAEGKTLPEGSKMPSKEDIQIAKQLLERARGRGMPFLIPEDTNKGFDIGPKTIASFNKLLAGAKTVFWNGPLGWFEKPEYAVGTYEVARALATTSSLKVVGGGDTVSAIVQSGVDSKFDHLSTGGGAVLEYLENEGLPGIDILKSEVRSSEIYS